MQVAVDLNGQGVDLEALHSKPEYRGPHVNSASPSGSASAPLPGDVLGFRPVADALLERLARGVGRLEEELGKLREIAGKREKKQVAGEAGVCLTWVCAVCASQNG